MLVALKHHQLPLITIVAILLFSAPSPIPSLPSLHPFDGHRHEGDGNRFKEDHRKGRDGEGKKSMENDVEGMGYLQAVVKETLRRHPPSHFVLSHAAVPHPDRGECGVLHDMGDGRPERVAEARGVAAGAVQGRWRWVGGGHDGDARGEDDAVRCREEDLPSGDAGVAPPAVDADEDGEGVPLGHGGQGAAGPNGDVCGVHHGNEEFRQGSHCGEGLMARVTQIYSK